MKDETFLVLGIGGTGMASLSHILLDYGVKLVGYDKGESKQISVLKNRGVTIFKNPEMFLESKIKSQITGTIHSSAIQKSPLLDWSHHNRIPIYHRSRAMHKLFSEKISISIAGSHGKTSTTGMLAQVLIESGQRPSVMIGGESDLLGERGGVWDSGKYGVYESDESDGTFLNHLADCRILTNIDDDHLDFYKTRENLLEAFRAYLKPNPYPKNLDLVVVYGDDPGIREVLSQMKDKKHIIAIGNNLDESEFKQVLHLDIGSAKSFLNLKGEVVELEIPFLGEHYHKNASLVFALAEYLEINRELILKSLANYKGIKRRMEVLGVSNDITILDDYGHHPTEVKAVIKGIQSAKKQGNANRTLVLFQPHRYTRTQNLFKEFALSLMDVDDVFLLPIYSAGEDSIPGVDSYMIADELKRYSKRVRLLNGSFQEDCQLIARSLVPGDIFVSLGAGDVRKWGEEIVKLLSSNKI